LRSINGDLALEALGEFVSEVDVETLIAATRKIWKGVRGKGAIDSCMEGGNSSALAGTVRNKTLAAAESRYRVMAAFPLTHPASFNAL